MIRIEKSGWSRDPADAAKLSRYIAKRRRDRFLRIVGSSIAAAVIGRYNTDLILYISSISLPTRGLKMSEIVSASILLGLTVFLVYLVLRSFQIRERLQDHRDNIRSPEDPELVARGFVGLMDISAQVTQAVQKGVVCGAFAIVYAITQLTSQVVNGSVSTLAIVLSGSMLLVGLSVFLCVKRISDGFLFVPSVLEPLLFYLVLAFNRDIDVSGARLEAEKILDRILDERPWWFS